MCDNLVSFGLYSNILMTRNFCTWFTFCSLSLSQNIFVHIQNNWIFSTVDKKWVIFLEWFQGKEREREMETYSKIMNWNPGMCFPFSLFFFFEIILSQKNFTHILVNYWLKIMIGNHLKIEQQPKLIIMSKFSNEIILRVECIKFYSLFVENKNLIQVF